MKAGYEAVIGLEVHVQLQTRSKMFCACRNEYGGTPNVRTCPVCLGLPGALPVINGEAVRMAIALGLAVGAEIRERSVFYRKQYFYPDLPKGYQITQGPVAVVERGRLSLPGDPQARGQEGVILAGIERAHLEEDAGKSNHDLGADSSYVDLNRAGVPLLEIVGAPDLRSGQEAYDYLKAVHRLVTFLGICDGNLEEGSMRCDANVSVHRIGAPLGTRVEVKNINSFRFVRMALDYEIDRQLALVEKGETFGQETRGWDAEKGVTRSQRSKEAAQDYRYFPEPDLPALVITPAEVEAVRATLPELPEARFERFTGQYGVSAYEAGVLLQSPAFADFFEAVAGDGLAKQAANWMLGEVSRALNGRGQGIEALGLQPAHLAELIRMVETGAVNLNTAKETVFPLLLAGEGAPADLVRQRGLGQVSDRAPIQAMVLAVLEANPGALAQYRGGKENLKGFFVGQVMKAGKGKMNPTLVNQVLEQVLASEETK
ncbi:MAG: Asp-tRNA(Asn)/Glu-tRNA(Gln) amidotransferase subunit GatB [Holophaga sp.]|nr:Asp-tRNA(Asn)/Glu-tRNA(Gln) amidotransferase subunit GatB [Holophaga sp.]